MNPIDVLKEYALSFLHTPYKWGGPNALTGIDCSGLVLELLKSMGHVHDDMTAQGIFDFYSNAGNGSYNQYNIGSLVFYGESASKITHVAMLLNQYQIIEAGGGGHLILTRDDAAAKSAMVRIRTIDYRKDRIAVIRPNYSTVGII